MSTSGPDSTFTGHRDPFGQVFLKFRNRSGSTLTSVKLYDGWPFTAMYLKRTCNSVSGTGSCDIDFNPTQTGFGTARVTFGGQTYDIYIQLP